MGEGIKRENEDAGMPQDVPEGSYFTRDELELIFYYSRRRRGRYKWTARIQSMNRGLKMMNN